MIIRLFCPHGKGGFHTRSLFFSPAEPAGAAEKKGRKGKAKIYRIIAEIVDLVKILAG
jgi:hypothetical protein